MTLLRRAAVLTSFGLLAVLLADPRNALARREPEPAKPAPDETKPEDRFRPDADAAAAARLTAARDLIRRADWVQVAILLQQVLDLDGDRFADVGDERRPHVVGAHAEAERLLAGLPADGRKAYQAFHEAAADLLKQAIQDKDESKIAEVVCRFLRTAAGPEALEALASLYYDAGRYHLAALAYTRLLGLRDAAGWAPETLFRAADACRRVGDKDGADLLGNQLLDHMGDKDVAVGERWFSRKDVQAELGKDAGRSAQAEGGMPFLRPIWHESTTIAASFDHLTFGEKVEALFKTASGRLAQVNQPVLSPQFPVTATVTFARDGKKHSVVVFRDHAGIAARDMTAGSGKLVGRAPIRGSLDWMMADSARDNALTKWTQQYVRQNERPGVLFENTTIGALSTDGELAYAVEDLAVPPPADFGINKGFPRNPNPWGWPPEILDMVNHSRLFAYDLASGCKVVWEAPEAGDAKSELADSYFLGPPLPLDGRLFVLAEKNKQLRLIGLETKQEKGIRRPQISFILPLGTVSTGLGEDVPRRLHAALPAYGDGVLVCPTNAGCVVGVDLLTHTLAWVHRYEEPQAAPAPPAKPPGFAPPIGRPAPQREWRNSAPVVSGGAVVVAPPDGNSVFCLDLKTGELRWKNPRQEGDLYLAGVFGGRVLVVGERVCRAYDLSDGKTLWTLDVGFPSGRGAASGGVYYLPLQKSVAGTTPEVCAIDVAKGKLVAHAPVGAAVGPHTGPPLGNLLFCDGMMVSQTTTEVAAFPPLKAKLEQMGAALANNPNDADGLFSRAELLTEEGNLPAAVEDLQKGIAAKPPQEVLDKARGKLYEVLTQLLQSDFDKGEKYLKEYEELCKEGADEAAIRRRRAGFLMLTGRGYEGRGRLLEALKTYEALGDCGDGLVASPDDPALQVSPAAWAQGRIDGLWQRATPEQRKQLQEEIDRRLKDAK